MSVPTRLVAFAAVLGLIFGGAALAGAALDPTDDPVTADAGHGDETEGGRVGENPAAARGEHGGGHGQIAVAPVASGVAVSQDGLTLVPDDTFFRRGQQETFSFQITDERGRVLRDEFEIESEREMHLIVVRADTATHQHLHPRKDADGTWSVELELPEPGVYRAYADFMIGGRQRALTTTLLAPGAFEPDELPAPTRSDSAGGLDVELKADGLNAGRESRLTFAVTRDGQPFDGLERYLGAKGHLVALRDGDLAYLHVHPTEGGAEHAQEDGPASGGAHPNEVPFAATFPTAGRYRLFLQVQTGGQIRTVAYTVEVSR